MDDSISFPSAGSGDYLPLSALNDFAFCKRRCALHRLENLWVESSHTVHGTLLHSRVHKKGSKTREDSTELRGLRILSHRLRLQGVADMVEFKDTVNGITPYPVEYKRGKVKAWDNDDIQVCAQAICLEEMLKTEVPKGAIYHIRAKIRREVIFDTSLRKKTARIANELHFVLTQEKLPPPVLLPHCKKCSLNHYCMPNISQDNITYLNELTKLFTP